MPQSLLRTDKEVAEIYDRQADTVYRVCFLFMKNPQDAEDMVQNTFLRLMSRMPRFENTDHEKAWLITTASNLCRDALRHWWHRTVGIDDTEPLQAPLFAIDETLQKVLDLPANYRTALYLRYYEGYSGAEISRMLHKSESTVRGWLRTGRNLLKLELTSEEA